jgi:hypothetical protein
MTISTPAKVNSVFPTVKKKKFETHLVGVVEDTHNPVVGIVVEVCC